jgi:hypothetical protein
MNKTDKAVKALNMKGMDADFIYKGHTSQLSINVNGVDFALHEGEIAKWADTYDELVADAPIEAETYLGEALSALDVTLLTDKVRENLQAAMNLLTLYSEHNQDND